MNRVVALVASLAPEFGSLIVYVALSHFVGPRAAVVGSTLYSVGAIGYYLLRGKPLTRIFLFSASMTVVFGAIDLVNQQPLMLKYEAVVTNLVTAVFFAASIFSKKSLIQDFYEQRPGAVAMRPDLAVYFRFLTGIWVLYFVLKAGAYYWIAAHASLEQTLVIRAVAGSVSFYVLLGISIFGSKGIIHGLRRLGLMPPPPAAPSVEGGLGPT